MGLPPVKIYDPRLGQDFRFKNAQRATFSSLEHGFYVLDNAYDLDLLKQGALLKECALKTSKLGFFTVSPWIPGAKKIRTKIKQEFQSVSESSGTLCGYFDIESDGIQKLLEIRKTFGEGKSGEWGFGGCIAEFSPPKRISLFKREAWDFPHLIFQSKNLGCLLYIGDGYSTFLTKTFDGFDSFRTREFPTPLPKTPITVP